MFTKYAPNSPWNAGIPLGDLLGNHHIGVLEQPTLGPHSASGLDQQYVCEVGRR